MLVIGMVIVLKIFLSFAFTILSMFFGGAMVEAVFSLRDHHFRSYGGDCDVLERRCFLYNLVEGFTISLLGVRVHGSRQGDVVVYSAT